MASLATAGASCCWRRHHPTNLADPVAGHGAPVPLEASLLTVAPDRRLRAQALCIGATARVAARRLAVRMPEAVVKARRRMARKHAQTNGDTPSPAHRTLMAWTLLMTNVPSTRGTTATVPQGDPRRWHIARLFQSWKSARHVAALTTTQEEAPFGSLSGRMRRMLWHDALGPQTRATRWWPSQRALRLLKCTRHFHAWAASGLPAILQSACALYPCLPRACTPAERLAAKAVRKRRTTAQILWDSLQNQAETVVFMEAVSA